MRTLWLLALSVGLSAHELGTTRVTAEFPLGRSYVVEIRTDAQALQIGRAHV